MPADDREGGTLNRIKSLLIANRGEIALRVIRACGEMGVKSVLAYSEADAGSIPVQMADQAICVGPSGAQASYQNQEALVSAALVSGVDAVHPGYGFLSENSDFALKCEEAGLIFVGPPSEVIRQMGNKIGAREIARRAGVPIIPGSDGAVSDEATALEIASSVAFPLLIKAAAGGGGRGMRVIRDADELQGAVGQVMSEAETAFGNPAVYIEKYLTDIRHIEVQILCDSENHIHLGERDCTIQRRNQKLVEEAPSPALNARTRDALCESALKLCREVGYRNAGTVEYVFDNETGKFYFIEMNTRVQVEHPVTELVTGIDIIRAQLIIADGQSLGLAQDQVVLNGNAIECRINAEDPDNQFMPSPGRIARFHMPGGLGVRMDSHIESGYQVPPFYDSMVGKLICWGRDRDEAIERMLRALREMRVDGITTTVPFHHRLIDHHVFRSGEFNTAFVSELLSKKGSS